MSPQKPAVRLFVMMLLQYFIWGAWLPLIWDYMARLGFTSGQIAIIGSTFAIASIAAIFGSNQFVDRTFSAERFMAASHLIAGVAMIGLFFARDFGTFFFLMLVHSVFYVPTLSVANTLALAHLKDAQREFGLIRMGGTIGWVIAAWPLYFLLQGVQGEALQRAVGHIFLMAGGAGLALAVFSLFLPHTPPQLVESGEGKLAWRRSVHILLANPYLWVLFIVTFIDSTIHNGYFLLTGGFLARIGVKPEYIMPVMSIGQVMEVLTMAVLGFFIRHLGWKWTLILGILGHAFRFFVFALFPHVVAAVIAVQLIHGVCYACFFATLYIFIDAAFPRDVRTSVQGLFNLLVLGLGDLAAKWLFIPLQDHLTTRGVTDYRTLFLVPALMAVAAALILLVAFRPPATLGAPTATPA